MMSFNKNTQFNRGRKPKKPRGHSKKSGYLGSNQCLFVDAKAVLSFGRRQNVDSDGSWFN
jgi:hypothetical protein